MSEVKIGVTVYKLASNWSRFLRSLENIWFYAVSLLSCLQRWRSVLLIWKTEITHEGLCSSLFSCLPPSHWNWDLLQVLNACSKTNICTPVSPSFSSLSSPYLVDPTIFYLPNRLHVKNCILIDNDLTTSLSLNSSMASAGQHNDAA